MIVFQLFASTAAVGLGVFAAFVSSATQTTDVGPQTSVDAALSAYMRVLQQHVTDVSLALYSPETRRLLAARRVTSGQQTAELREIQAVYESRAITERADLAVVRFPGSTRVPPYFFRRLPAGWTIDLAATSRVIGFDQSNRWYVRDTNSEFAFGLETARR